MYIIPLYFGDIKARLWIPESTYDLLYISKDIFKTLFILSVLKNYLW